VCPSYGFPDNAITPTTQLSRTVVLTLTLQPNSYDLCGLPPREVCRQIGVSEATFYAWKKKYGGMGVSELKELWQLCDENLRLKRLVADLTLDKHILQEVLSKKFKARAIATVSQSNQRRVRPQRSADLPGDGSATIDLLLSKTCEGLQCVKNSASGFDVYTDSI